MKFKSIIKIILFIISIISLNLSYSQDDTLEYKIDLLEENDFISPEKAGEMEIISASRTSKKVTDLPVTIYVVTREEIINNGYITLVDVLKSIPGIRTSQPGSADAGEMFQMRGMLGNNYAKILINDIPVKPGVVTAMPIGAQIPIRQAERIEITLGPASAVYGADALVGVINIITKKPEAGIFANADIDIIGKDRYINFQVGGKAGKNEKVLKYSFYGSHSSRLNANILKDSSLFRPLAYFDGIMDPITIPEGTFKPGELTQELYDKYDMSQYFFPTEALVQKIDTITVSDIPSESRLLGFEFAYKNFSISMLNMYRKIFISKFKTQ